MEKDYLLKERPLRALLLFALPMIIGNLFQQFYTMADSMVVGRYVSENALAAVGASYSLTNVFICVAIGGGVGASVLTSQYFGAREYGRMKQSVSTALLTFLAVSLALASLGLAFGREFMVFLKTPEDILDMTVEYLNIYFMGLPFLFMYNVLSSMFNALGRSRIPLYLLIFSSIFNIVLDIYLVRSLGLGIAGVAWATLIAQGISAFLSFLIFLGELRGYPGADTKMESVRKFYSTEELFTMCRVALPSIFQQSTVSIGMMLVQSVVNSFGPQMLAGFSAGMRVESICIVPMAALGNAMSSYTAQNLGAEQEDRVVKGYRAALCLTAFFALLLCLALELFHFPIIASFLGSDGTMQALETGSSYLRFIGFFFALIGLKMCTDGLLRGAADMKMFTIANLANLSLRVAFAIAMAPRFGIAMVWYAVPLGWLVNFLISYGEYRTGRWRKKCVS
ncbi:MAG: MATE family efflux transporter [Lachnospiraceae bacterium]|nr:MATE family efflux transporter [Lachnospiraceae bacterium]MCI9622434.1 MATE family efflux transporter [Lachnospiraceae bacterium]